MRLSIHILIGVLMMTICHPLTLKAAGLASHTSRTKSKKGFAIYLVARGVTSRELSKPDIGQLRIESKPIVSMDDIVGYSRLMHEIELTDTGWQRITKREVYGSGRPFVVYVDDEPIYLGAFWTPEPGVGKYPGPVVASTHMTAGHPVIQLGLTFLVTSKTSAEDKRSDPRIMRVFEQTDRLKEVLSSGGVRALRDDEQQLVLEETPNRNSTAGRKFSLLLRPDGTATYFGFQDVEKMGQHSGEYPKEEYSRLSALLLTLKLYDYDDSASLQQPRILGILQKGNLRMIVDDLIHTPADLLVVEKEFEDVAARIKWTREPVARLSGIRGTANLDAFRELRGELSFRVQVTLAGGGKAINSQTLTGNGDFEFNLPPGVYIVRGGSGWRRRGAPPRSRTQFVNVEPGKFTQVAIDYRG